LPPFFILRQEIFKTFIESKKYNKTPLRVDLFFPLYERGIEGVIFFLFQPLLLPFIKGEDVFPHFTPHALGVRLWVMRYGFRG